MIGQKKSIKTRKKRALGDWILTINEDSTVNLKKETADISPKQQWIREVQDEVDGWFTLYNPDTKSYLAAEDSNSIKATSKNHQKFQK